VRSRIEATVLPFEAREFAEEIRRVFTELGLTIDLLSGEFSPPLDVHETDQEIEVTMDLPGLDPDRLRIVIKGNAMLIAGEKPPRHARGDSTFHLVERSFGRFIRIVQLVAACDTGHARATLRDGELKVSVRKIQNRRGKTIDVPVS